eukprot:GHVN01033004.1.p1 GENE.GHVN01033004.1~~GHVN01033004.1.p1  ORF type:complete len:2505 (-),score=137.99 GHVN01033004.1:220-7734(-)
MPITRSRRLMREASCLQRRSRNLGWHLPRRPSWRSSIEIELILIDQNINDRKNCLWHPELKMNEQLKDRRVQRTLDFKQLGFIIGGLHCGMNENEMLTDNPSMLVESAVAAVFFRKLMFEDVETSIEIQPLEVILRRIPLLQGKASNQMKVAESLSLAFRKGGELGKSSLIDYLKGEIVSSKRNVPQEYLSTGWDDLHQTLISRLESINLEEIFSEVSADLSLFCQLSHLLSLIDATKASLEVIRHEGNSMLVTKSGPYLGFFMIDKNKKKLLLITTRDHLLNLLGSVDAQLIVRVIVKIGEKTNAVGLPTHEMVISLLEAVRKLQRIAGNSAFFMIKNLEPLLTGIIVDRGSTNRQKERLVRTAMIEMKSKAPKLELAWDFEAFRFLLDEDEEILLERLSGGTSQLYTMENEFTVGEVFRVEIDCPKGKMEAVETLIESVLDMSARALNLTQLSEMFGLVKSIFGYATPDWDASFRASRSVMNNPSLPTMFGRRLVLESRGRLIEAFCQEYLRRHGRLPPASNSERLSNVRLRNLFLRHRVAINTMSAVPVTPLEWAEVRLQGVLKFEVYREILPYVEDKATARPIGQIASIYTLNSTHSVKRDHVSLNHRRLIREVMNLAGEMDLMNEISSFGRGEYVEEQLIYLLKTKERQVSPGVERAFGFTTPRYRLILGAMEKEVANKIFNYLPGIALGASEHEQNDRLENTTGSKRRFWTAIINLDYLKWCGMKTDWGTSGTTGFCDEVFDFEDGITPFGRIHEFYGKCIYVNQESVSPPTELMRPRGADFKRRDLSNVEKEMYKTHVNVANRRHLGENINMPDSENIFGSDNRGVEGQCQKMWTVDSYGDILSVVKCKGADAQVAIQGDNCSIFLKISIPDYIPYGSEMTAKSMRIRDEAVLEIEEELVRRSKILGKPLKATETWASDSLCIFGKKFVSNRTILGQGLKQGMKLSSETNDVLVSSDSRVGGIFSSASSASNASFEGSAFFIAAWARSSIELMTDFVENSVHTRGRANDLNSILIGKKDRLNFYLYVSLTMTSNLSFAPSICVYSSTRVRSTPDPASDALASIRCQAMGGSYYAKIVYTYIDSSKFELGVLKNAEPLIESPGLIPILRQKPVESLIIRGTREALGGIRKSKYTEALMSEATSRSGESIKTALTLMTPHFNPRVAGSIYEKTASARAHNLASKCNSRSTLKSLGGLSEDTILKAATNHYLNIAERVKFCNEAWNHRKEIEEFPEYTPAGLLARRLRKNCVASLNKSKVEVDGCTTPSAADQFAMVLRSSQDPLPRIPHALITVDLGEPKGALPLVEAKGPGRTYYGSDTKAKMTPGEIRVTKYEPILRSTLRLVSEMKFAITKDNRMSNLIDQIVTSQSDSSLDELWKRSGIQTEGCVWHRLQNAYEESGASLAMRGGMTSFFRKLSDELAPLSDGSQVMILFQAVFLNSYALLTSALSQSLMSDKDIFGRGRHLSLLLFPIKGTWFEAYEGRYDLSADSKFLPPPRILKASFKDFEWGTSRPNVADLGLPTIEADSVGVEESAGAVVHMESFRPESLKVRSGAGGDEPVLRPGDAKRLMWERVLEDVTKRILVDEVMDILSASYDGIRESLDLKIGAKVGARSRLMWLEACSLGRSLSTILMMPKCRSQYFKILSSCGPEFDSTTSINAMGRVISRFVGNYAAKLVSGERQFGDLIVFDQGATVMSNQELAIKSLKTWVLKMLCEKVKAPKDCKHLRSFLSAGLGMIRSEGDAIDGLIFRKMALFSTSALENLSFMAEIVEESKSGSKRGLKVCKAHPRSALALAFRSRSEWIPFGESERPTIGEIVEPPLPASSKYRNLASKHFETQTKARWMVFKPTLGTNQYFDLQLTHIFKDHCFLSSAWIKLLDVLRRNGGWSERCLCLADGPAGFASFLSRLTTTSRVFYQSLTQPLNDDTMPGQLFNSIPEEMAVLPPAARKKITAFEEMMSGPSDLLRDDTIKHISGIIAKYEKVDLITCDAKLAPELMMAHNTIENHFRLFLNVGRLAEACLKVSETSRLVIKGFRAVPAVYQTEIAALSAHFNNVTDSQSLFSSSSGTEVYFVCTGLKEHPSDLEFTKGKDGSTSVPHFLTDESLAKAQVRQSPLSDTPFPLHDSELASNSYLFSSRIFGSRAPRVLENMINYRIESTIERGCLTSLRLKGILLRAIKAAQGISKSQAISSMRASATVEGFASNASPAEQARTYSKGIMRKLIKKSELHFMALDVLLKLIENHPKGVLEITKLTHDVLGQKHRFRTRDLRFTFTADRYSFSRVWARQIMIVYGFLAFKSPFDLKPNYGIYTMSQGGNVMSDHDDILHSRVVSTDIALRMLDIMIQKNGDLSNLRVVDLFAGRGGLTAAFLQALIRVRLARVEAFVVRPGFKATLMKRTSAEEREILRCFNRLSTSSDLPDKPAQNQVVYLLDIPWDHDLEVYPGLNLTLIVNKILRAKAACMFTSMSGYGGSRESFNPSPDVFEVVHIEGRDVIIIA